LKIVDKLCEAGAPKKVNEDSWGAHGQLLWVVDGATCLGDNSVAKDGNTDAAWLSQTITDFLGTYNVCEENFSWRRIYEDISQYVQDSYQAQGGAIPDNVWEEPLAAMKTLYNFGDGRVTCSGLADCVILIETTEGLKAMYGDDLHAELDKTSTAAIAPYLKEGLGFVDARAKVIDVFQNGRMKVNRPEGGFWDFSITPNFFNGLQKGNFKVNTGAHAFVMSDGFYRLVEMFDKYTDETLIEAVKSRGLRALYDELRQIEDDDDLGKIYPRGKKGDDVTGVLIEF